jgi:hypothetical protein
MASVKKDKKKYGSHDYVTATPKDPECHHRCGCWFNFETGNGGGELGLDHHGECPNNPLDGKRLDGNLDHIAVVESRLATEKRKLSKMNKKRRASDEGTKRSRRLRDWNELSSRSTHQQTTSATSSSQYPNPSRGWFFFKLFAPHPAPTAISPYLPNSNMGP